MYNLFVSGNDEAWEGEPYLIETSRCVREYTDTGITKRFAELDATAIGELQRFPCIFAYESGCKKPPRFGVIRNITKRQEQVRIEYVIKDFEPFLTVDDLTTLAFELDIEKYEMNRTHWAVKDVDLVRELRARGISLPGWARNIRKALSKKNHLPAKIYKVGEKSSTGHKIAEILGQSPLACVYTTADNQLRWVYYPNDGLLPDKLGAMIARFDTLMSDIKALHVDPEIKRDIFMLLGKSLFVALNSKKPKSLPNVFKEVERRISNHAEARSTSNLKSAGDKDLIKFDVAIVCALHEPELTSVLSIGRWSQVPALVGDPQTYYSSVWRAKEGQNIRVVVAAPNYMGLTASGVLASKIVWRFRPRLLAIVGIAAGARSDKQGFGDILAPDQTFDYGSGKTTLVGRKSKVLPNPNPLQINAKLHGRLKEWQRERTSLDNIVKMWRAEVPLTRLQLHIGPLFSSPTVLDNTQSIDEAMSHWRKLIGIEMEAHAVHRACHDTIEPAPMFLCLKSICDFAEGKDDKWQHYAAYTSARLLYKFLVAEWPRLSS